MAAWLRVLSLPMEAMQSQRNSEYLEVAGKLMDVDRTQTRLCGFECPAMTCDSPDSRAAA
jgi:hypothetical protein